MADRVAEQGGTRNRALDRAGGRACPGIGCRGRYLNYVLEVPVGFTCDHMETLYDIDIVHREHAADLGLTSSGLESLNTSRSLIKALADIVTKAK